MDTAFQSRIHLTLEYPNLDAQARRAIWSTFLDRAASEGMAGKGDDFDEAALSMLSSIDLNGRQIKNTMKMAQLLAMQTGARLTLGHVKTVLRIQGQMGRSVEMVKASLYRKSYFSKLTKKQCNFG
ncbi:hypothetical protein BB8028_0001g01730 [Beauveria bassiana]|uniref:AAA+ ATPase lid domain-containing protein n=1 Tax=Beauveria bassiana TaxID=176275 RepID=A0A2S7XWD9_BEABA|nr:hypothetical protein BB8028_0001g01730 [Beauveria bassiana]